MNARSVLRNSTLYTVSAIVTGLLLHATDAAAVYWEEVTAAACAPVTGSSLVFSSNGSVGGSGTMVCPFQHEDDQPGPANAIDVFVRDDATGAITAQACATVTGSTGEYCGTPVATSGTGWKIMHFNPGIPWIVYGFYYLRVTLPANSGNSRLTGIGVGF